MTKSRITVIIQVRVGSQRLAKKVLRKILGKPMIWYVLKRVKRIKKIQQIVIATTIQKEDDIIVKIAKENGIAVFRGSEIDVLDRYYNCAKEFNADPIIRITSDCPLIDPFLVNELLEYYIKHDFDYVSNTIVPTYPDGLDIEIFSFKTLENAAINAKMRSEREHVSPYIKNHPKKFKLYNYKNKKDLSTYRWTVDEPRDLQFIRKIYSQMRPELIFSMKDVLSIILKNPKITDINRRIIRNEGYVTSLEKDKKKEKY